MNTQQLKQLSKKFNPDKLYTLYLKADKDVNKIATSIARVGDLTFDQAVEFLNYVIEQHEFETIKSRGIKNPHEDTSFKTVRPTKKENKRNQFLFIAFNLSIIYSALWLICCGINSIFALIQMLDLSLGNIDSTELYTSLSLFQFFPHVLCSTLGTLFNGIALFLHKRWAALAAAIFYTIAIAILPLFFLFIIVQMILTYIAFAKMEKE